LVALIDRAQRERQLDVGDGVAAVPKGPVFTSLREAKARPLDDGDVKRAADALVEATDVAGDLHLVLAGDGAGGHLHDRRQGRSMAAELGGPRNRQVAP